MLAVQKNLAYENDQTEVQKSGDDFIKLCVGYVHVMFLSVEWETENNSKT